MKGDVTTMKRSKKLTSLIMAALLMLSVTACGEGASGSSEAGKDSSSENVSSSSVSASDDLFDENGRYKEPVTITYSKVMYPGAKFPADQSPEQNYINDFLKERYNIEMKLAWSAEGSEYNNKLSINIASGELCDLMFVDKYITFRQMAENDLLADLTEIYPKYRGATLELVDNSFENRNIEAVTVEGKQLAVPGSNLGYGQNLLWLRKDWLDALDLEVPKTLDEIAAVLEAFVNEDPDGNGQNDTVGLVVQATTPVSGYSNNYGLESVFNAFDVFPTQWLTDDEGKVYYGSTDPKMKDALTLLADWYQRGLIDKQFPTRIGSGETEALWTSGTAGAKFGPWWAVANEALTNTPDIEYVAVAGPVNSKGEFNYMTGAPTGSVSVVSEECEHPEAAIIALAANNEVVRGTYDKNDEIACKYGEQSQELRVSGAVDDAGGRSLNVLGALTFDYFDVVPKLSACVKDNIENGSYTEYPGMTDYDKSQCIAAKKFADGDKDEASFWAYWTRYVGGNVTEEGNPVYPAYYFETESSTTLKAALDKLEDEMYLQIIVGEKPVDYFDEFVSQWKALGGDTLTEEVQVIVDQG